MNAVVRKIGLACALIMPFGCDASVSETGPATVTPEMTDEHKKQREDGMKESLKYLPKEVQEQGKKSLESQQKSD